LSIQTCKCMWWKTTLQKIGSCCNTHHEHDWYLSWPLAAKQITTGWSY
jgi:hypothetical protein